jgi:hypothetical protein
MDFREATDALFERVTHEALAEKLGVSVASIRQARLDPKALAVRSPPEGWAEAVAALATERERHYRRLAQKLKG